MTHVVHVTEANGAGVETYLRLAADHVSDVDQTFVLGTDHGLAAELRERGHAVHLVDLPRTTTRLAELRASRRLRRLLDSLAPDVVHLHSSQAGLVGRIATRRRPYRVIYTPHAYYYLGKTGLARVGYLAAERVLARAFPTELVATSPSELRRAVDDVKVRRASATSVLNGIELPSAAPRVAGTPFRVGLVGRVSPQKNLPVYLHAVADLAASGPQVLCHLVGVGHYPADRDALAAMMVEAGLAPHDLDVIAWMTRPDLLAWLATCDVVVLTSTYESFGYTLAEATARGVPVVAADVDGVCDVVVEGVNGYLVPADDPAALAARIRDLAADPALYAELSRGALQTAGSRLDVRTWAERLGDHYQQGGRR